MKLSEILQKIDSIEEGKKGVDMPNTHIKFVGFGKDSNGNSVIKLKNSVGKGFSIQTNGNLPKTHSIKIDGIKKPTGSDLDAISKEVSQYVEKHGTKVMKG